MGSLVLVLSKMEQRPAHCPRERGHGINLYFRSIMYLDLEALEH